MTLNDLVEAVSRLKGWKPDPSQGAAGFDVPQGAGRKQFVAAAEFRNDGETMVRFTTRIGPADRLEATRLRSALELNYRLPHGCLAVEGGHLVMTETESLQHTTAPSAATVVEYLAKQADQYEKLIFRTDVH